MARGQLGFRYKQDRRGGVREGAGRPPKGERAGVVHAARPRFDRRMPVHVTVRMAEWVWNLRSGRAMAVLRRALVQSADRFGARVVQFAVLGNHIHLLLEADHTAALVRGMRGLSIRIAKGLNRLMSRNGRVLGDRYHARVLRTPTEVRRATTTEGTWPSTASACRRPGSIPTPRTAPPSASSSDPREPGSCSRAGSGARTPG